MKTTKIALVSMLTLFTVNLYGEGAIKITGTKPVDEGDKIVHQEETIKGSHDFNNTRSYKTVSISTIKKSLIVKRQDINHAPFICLYYNGKSKKITTIAKQESGNSINFNIKKTELKKNDRIFIINNVDSKKRNRPMGKDVIIEIEILK